MAIAEVGTPSTGTVSGASGSISHACNAATTVLLASFYCYNGAGDTLTFTYDGNVPDVEVEAVHVFFSGFDAVVRQAAFAEPDTGAAHDLAVGGADAGDGWTLGCQDYSGADTATVWDNEAFDTTDPAGDLAIATSSDGLAVASFANNTEDGSPYGTGDTLVYEQLFTGGHRLITLSSPGTGGSVTVSITPGSGGCYASCGANLLAAAGEATLTVEDGAHAHDAAAVTLSAILAAHDALHLHAAALVSLPQQHGVTVGGALHAHPADLGSFTGAQILSPAAAGHPHAGIDAALAQVHALAPAAATHDGTAETAIVSVGHLLQAQAAVLAHSGEAGVLAQLHLLAPASALHDGSAAAAALAGLHLLAPVGASHSHAAELAAIAAEVALAIADAGVDHAVDEAALAEAHRLAVAAALHLQLAPGPAFVALHDLAVALARHGVPVETVSVFEGALIFGPGKLKLGDLALGLVALSETGRGAARLADAALGRLDLGDLPN